MHITLLFLSKVNFNYKNKLRLLEHAVFYMPLDQ
jgi:hypothetical protein